MHHNDECNIRLDAYGRADVEYYLGKARNLRAEFIAAWYRALGQKLLRLVCQPLFGCRNLAASH